MPHLARTRRPLRTMTDITSRRWPSMTRAELTVRGAAMEIELIGRRVKVTRWEYARFLAAYAGRLPICRVPRGRVTHVELIGDGESDIWVQLDGLDRELAFDPSQLQIVG
jgi:hypothetical protein